MSKVKISYHSSSSADESEEDDHQIDLGKDISSAKKGNEAVADVMAKILGKSTSGKGTAILSKAKTDREHQRKKLKEDDKSEIETVKIKKEKTDSDSDSDNVILQKQKKQLWENLGRVKPDVLEKEKERQLQRLATRGVVQLFNAVKKQQKLVDEQLEEVGPSERKKEKVLQKMNKGQFMDVLKGSAGAANVKVEPNSKKIKTESELTLKQEEEDPSWNILRDDYMMGAKMKDWEKSSDATDNDDQRDSDNSMDDSDMDS